jgi:hypothetical protein
MKSLSATPNQEVKVDDRDHSRRSGEQFSGAVGPTPIVQRATSQIAMRQEPRQKRLGRIGVFAIQAHTPTPQARFRSANFNDRMLKSSTNDAGGAALLNADRRWRGQYRMRPKRFRTVDGIAVARTLNADRKHGPLALWNVCRVAR